MSQIAETLAELGTWTLRNSVAGGILIVLLGILYLVFRKQVATGFWVILWTVAGVRLLLPVAPESSLSLFNLGTTLQPDRTPDSRFASAGIAGSAPIEALAIESMKSVDGLVNPPRESPCLPFVLSSIWIVGAVGIPLFALAGYAAMARQVRRYPAVDDSSLERILRQCAREAGFEKAPTLVEGSEGTGVAVFGGLRPTHLIIPRHFSRQFSPPEIRSVFLHEMAHIRRGDLLWNWITLVVESLHWFNPLVWWAGRRFTAERELLCDRFVLAKLSGKDQHTYGQALIKTVEYGIRPSPVIVPFLSRKGVVRSGRRK